jgi:hypothetical protein
MKTKSLILLLFASVLSASVCAASPVKETRQTGSFRKISAGSGVDVYFTQANTQSVEVEADTAVMKQIITEVKDETLIIRVEKQRISRILKNNYNNMKVYVSAPEINEINVSGGADFYADALKCNKDFRLNSSGGADANIGKISVEGNTTIATSSGSDIKIKELNAENADISASGGSDLSVTLNVQADLNLNASGGSDISVSGTANLVKANASGGSDIDIRKLKRTNVDVKSSGGSDVYP